MPGIYGRHGRYVRALKIQSFDRGIRYDIFSLPFSSEKRVKLFRRALLEVIEGSRLLAPTANTRSMSGFCAAVDIASCASRIANLSNSGVTLRKLPMLAVPCGCSVLPIDIRFDSYQVSGAQYTGYTRKIYGYLLRLLPVLMIEYFMMRYCAYSTHPVLAVVWADTARILLLRCCYCCCCCASCC